MRLRNRTVRSIPAAAVIVTVLASLSFAASAAHADDGDKIDTPISIVIPSVAPTPTPTPTPTQTDAPPPAASVNSNNSSNNNSSSNSNSNAGTTPPPPSDPVAPTPGAEPVKDADKARIDNPRPSAGDTVTVTGTGFTAGEQVQLVLYSVPVVIASYPAGEDGVVVAQFAVPKDMATGDHTAEITGWSSSHVQNVVFSVVSKAGSWGVAADSGVWMWWLLAGVAAALVVAVLFVLWLRNRGVSDAGLARA